MATTANAADTVAIRGAAIVAVLLLVAAFVSAGSRSGEPEVGAGRVGAASVAASAGSVEPDSAAAGRVRTQSLLDCILGCATKATDCATVCSGRPLGEAPDCALACVERDATCIAACGPAFRPAPPAE